MTAGHQDVRFEFRPVRLEEFERYDEIMMACLGYRPDAGYFQWKYLENPAGRLIAFEAVHEARIAAFYGVIPWYYDVAGERCLFYQSMDTMTHPDYQRRGLFVALANLTYAEVTRRSPEHVLVGVPGPTSFPGFVGRLDWMNPVSFRYMFVARPLFRAMALVNRRVRLEYEPITSVESLRGYFARREPSRAIAPALFPEFLEWRVLNHRLRRYSFSAVTRQGEAIGLVVHRVDTGGRVFIELLDFVSPAYCASCTYPALQQVFAETGARALYTWEPTRADIRTALRRAGFVTNPLGRGPFSYHVPFIVRAPHTVFREFDLRRSDSYDLQPLLQD